MITSTHADALTLDLALRPYELMAAWRPASRNLVLVVNEPVAIRQTVQARINVLGHAPGATIVGSAAKVSPHPLGVELELEPDALRAPTLEALVARVASGGRGALPPRPPRWLAEVPACVYRLYHFKRTRTFSVSEGGVGLRWSGELPPVGATVQLHLGTAAQYASFCAEVRWTSPPERAPAVGLRLDAGDRDAWVTMLSVLRHAGAPSADAASPGGDGPSKPQSIRDDGVLFGPEEHAAPADPVVPAPWRDTASDPFRLDPTTHQVGPTP